VTTTRRRVLRIGGVILAGLAGTAPGRAGGAAEIAMRGNEDGSDVWYDPIGLHVRPGQTIRWTNHDAGNAHTATAYHPHNAGRPDRIPEGAAPWDSDYLLPGESFAVTLLVEGVYDYFCIPHEQAGMVGRIVVGSPPVASEAAGSLFPSVGQILREGSVRRSRTALRDDREHFSASCIS
jgi:plastocyanin